MLTLFFILFGALAVGCAVALVTQRNPLYCAISLIGVFVSLACIYITLAAPFIAAVQVIVYAGAIMVLVVFVIMLLNVEEEERRPLRRTGLLFVGVTFAALLLAEAFFVIAFVRTPSEITGVVPARSAGLTGTIGTGLFTKYLLPFEITSALLLMAIVGSMSLARRALPPQEVGEMGKDAERVLGGKSADYLTAGATPTTGAASPLRDVSAKQSL